jgi:hypothetical protein
MNYYWKIAIVLRCSIYIAFQVIQTHQKIIHNEAKPIKRAANPMIGAIGYQQSCKYGAGGWGTSRRGKMR